jgi:3-hydroxyethyl bacteriochlorophyllide a dehydrogenase
VKQQGEGMKLDSVAVVFQEPGMVALKELCLSELGAEDVLVETMHSGISTGTERLLWTGRMPQFPGMGYPLVPGYESVGRVVDAGVDSRSRIGDFVFVPGAKCYGEVRGLFGGSASKVVLPSSRAMTIDESLADRGVLLALAATAYHVAPGNTPQPDLIIGHGVLGRLVARLAVVAGGKPTVWETNPARRNVAEGYSVIDPSEDDPSRRYHSICDVSGDARLVDTLIARLAPGGEVVLAGFYEGSISFAFAQAFMREARIRIAAQWQPGDLVAVKDMAESGHLSLDGLITHRCDAITSGAVSASYNTAFTDASCLKMILNWSARA